MKKYRTWAEVDLDTISSNVQTIEQSLQEDTDILVVVKADAYGHGDVAVARTCLESGAEMVGVGDSSEAIALREAGIRSPILILGAMIEEEIGWVVSYQIQPTLHSMEMVDKVAREARRQNQHLPVHVMINTGMVRLGASPESGYEIVREVKQTDYLQLEGISTHLCSVYGAENGQDITRRQMQMFQSFLDRCRSSELHFEYAHVSSSGGVFLHPEWRGDMVRTGIAVYGVQPGRLETVNLSLEPALSLHSQITFLRGVRAGTQIGYDHTYTVPDDTVIGTVPIGYHDGYPFSLSNNTEVLVNGTRCPVVGTVTMDYTMVDVGELDNPEVGDRVTLIGKQKGAEISVKEVADRADTIPYEILCTLGKRVKRVYV